jgi:hypothetical protein
MTFALLIHFFHTDWSKLPGITVDEPPVGVIRHVEGWSIAQKVTHELGGI